MSLVVIAAGGVTAALLAFVVKAGVNQRASGRAQEEAWQVWRATGRLQPGWDPRFAWAEQSPQPATGQAVAVRGPAVQAWAVATDVEDVVDAEVVEPLALPAGREVSR
jgi:hypothetical protein